MSVYFMQDGHHGRIKIGFSNDLEERLKDLRTANPDIRLLGSIPGDRTKETLVHRMFSKHRIEGEWFDPCDYLMWFIKMANERESAVEIVRELAWTHPSESTERFERLQNEARVHVRRFDGRVSAMDAIDKYEQDVLNYKQDVSNGS